MQPDVQKTVPTAKDIDTDTAAGTTVTLSACSLPAVWEKHFGYLYRNASESTPFSKMPFSLPDPPSMTGFTPGHVSTLLSKAFPNAILYNSI